jgi:hypothetical protein
MKKIIYTSFFLLTLLSISDAKAQVGVGTIAPVGALDVTSTTNGLLIPRVALTATNVVAPVITATESEMVYNTATAGAGITAVTPGYYYLNTAATAWIRLATGTNSDWSLLGNAGTVAATNFIGTTDAIDFVTRTNNTEKMRVTSAGNVGIGIAAPTAKLDIAAGVTTTNSVVNATGSINDFLQYNIQNTSTGTQAQSGYSATADNGSATTGFAWIGINNSTFNFPTAYNIGIANDVSYVGSGQDMYIANANNTKSIIFSTGKATSPYFNERMRLRNDGNLAVNNTGNAYTKIRSVTTGAGNDGVTSVNNDNSTGKGNAFWGTNANATGIAILGGAGGSSVVPTLGTGVAGSHTDGYGIFANTGNGAPNNAAHNGHSAGYFSLDTDNDPATDNGSAFAKIAGKDDQSVTPLGASSRRILYGGYFSGGTAAGGQSYSYVGLNYNHANDATGSGGTMYKIVGNGTVSTLIPDENNTPRVMFCPEAPEVLFEDYGIGKLVNGQAYIELDKILAKSLKVDEKHPLKVFIQLEGDCKGVYVTDKSINGFKVKEQNGGTSNIDFSWHIVANRADSKAPNGNITSKFEDLRLPIGPSPLKETPMVSKNMERK